GRRHRVLEVRAVGTGVVRGFPRRIDELLGAPVAGPSGRPLGGAWRECSVRAVCAMGSTGRAGPGAPRFGALRGRSRPGSGVVAGCRSPAGTFGERAGVPGVDRAIAVQERWSVLIAGE